MKRTETCLMKYGWRVLRLLWTGLSVWDFGKQSRVLPYCTYVYLRPDVYMWLWRYNQSLARRAFSIRSRSCMVVKVVSSYTSSFLIEFASLFHSPYFTLLIFIHIELYKTSALHSLKGRGLSNLRRVDHCLRWASNCHLHLRSWITCIGELSFKFSKKKHLCNISCQLLRNSSFTPVATTLSAFNYRMGLVQCLLLPLRDCSCRIIYTFV